MVPVTLATVVQVLTYRSERVPSYELRHPVAVVGREVPMQSIMDQSQQAETLNPGDTLDLQVVQPNGWCLVVLPKDRREGSGPGNFDTTPGYVQR
ncbi:hypothetical protein [Solirubrum puertoriconensis]|uniref:Uncharacterized protein n=1 Tax=Solirubrum puertoriconensis TaxID=1751427 RepID=A0A9X0HH82_SOLP1|nr:hypothetical protein [Solirubrum puertoriconensis]KUG05836.1 hypothetical protein ASU33_00145 [Solirubrum puertoriconensis]